MSMLVVGVDPGKKGYACFLGNTTSRKFWPAPVTQAEDDDKMAYDLPKLVRTTMLWYEDGVRLVALEAQAPRRHGKHQKEGTISSWTNGYGFGCWETALVAAGFAKADDEASLMPDGRDHKAVTGMSYGASCSFYVIVEPRVWKSRMGCIAHHEGEDTHAARRKAADARSIEVATKVDPSVDLRPLERAPGARTPSPDKACSVLLAHYARWIISGRGS